MQEATTPIMSPVLITFYFIMIIMIIFLFFFLAETNLFFLQFLGTSFFIQSPSFDFNRLLDDR